jgi:leucyl/phenylalanyl-tRNA--protein transferase
VASRSEKALVLARRQLQPPVALLFGLSSQLLGPAARRAGVFTKTPPAWEIVANFTRGWVLFGHSSRGVYGLEWHRFPQRAVITQETAHVPKKLQYIQRREKLEVRFDEDFEMIVELCREGRSGWLTKEAVNAYRTVHDLGFSATVGTYRDGRLVGGMWGIAVGGVFTIMSMFHSEDHAGSLAIVAVAERVIAGDRWTLVDFGFLTDNSKRYGANYISTDKFCEAIWESMPTAR